MRSGRLGLAVVIGLMMVAGEAGPAAADPSRGAVVVPVVGAGGRPVFCTANESGGRARPRTEGGYRVAGLPPGRHVVHLELADERVDVLVSVVAGDEVWVPPVFARGPCRRLALRAPLVDLEAPDEEPAWSLRIGPRYQAVPAVSAAAFERDRSLLPARVRPRRWPSTQDL